LIGITDTAMLRPQVFALQDGAVQIGLICSEKQAIDATLQSLAAEDDRFCPVADKYWNARGGSATDGGAFMFTIRDSGTGNGSKKLICTNKFGQTVTVPKHQKPEGHESAQLSTQEREAILEQVTGGLARADFAKFKRYCTTHMAGWSYASLRHLCRELVLRAGQNDAQKGQAIELLTHLNNRRFPIGEKKRSVVLHVVRESLREIFNDSPGLDQDGPGRYRHIDWATRRSLRGPAGEEKILVLNAREFPPQGNDCDARLICKAYQLGWKQFICYGYRGQRFTGCGLSQGSDDVRIDVYDSSGDYLASGIDGLEIRVHGHAQDQLGQIMKRGKLVIFGDVGQTFMYGAKGGEVYVMGNAAGRPLINAVGSPRVVINGTCLDYLAESFMAGDPLSGGGFVILNGLEFDPDGNVQAQPSPYPGSNLFSLASGGAIYLRDPHRLVVEEQLNGGELVELTPADWELILPYLEQNEGLFGISIRNDLLTVDGVRRSYDSVYRKVQAVKTAVLAAASAGSEEWGEDWDSS
jgi:hypothetical protein